MKALKYKKPLDNNPFYRILHIHSFALLYRRLFGNIETSDFYDLPEDAEPEKLQQRFEDAKYSLPQNKRYLKRILFSVFKWELILGIVMSFVVAFLLLESPLIMKTILEYIEKRDVTAYETKQVRRYIWTWLVVFFVKIFFTEMTDRIFFRIGLKMELLLTTMFIQKVTLIATNQEDTHKAKIMNCLMVEIRKIHIFFKKGSWLFSQPPVLILAVLLVFLEGKEFGMLLYEILFVFVVLSMIVDVKMQECHHQKGQLARKRINTSIQMLRQHRPLKSLGWEGMIHEGSEFYRNQQNQYNGRYILYKRVNEILLIMVTGVYFSILFALKYRDSEYFQNLSLADIFTMTIFIYLLKAPIKNIRYVATYFQEMMEALKLIEHFLEQPELRNINRIGGQENTGTISCRKVVILNSDTDKQGEQLTDVRTLLMKKSAKAEQFNIRKDLEVSLDIKIMRGEKVSILSNQLEGSTFLAAIVGNIAYNKGLITYGGRLTYQPAKIWLTPDTILANILIGRPLDIERLKMVYEVADLNDELKFLIFNQRTRISDSLSLSEGQKRKIILARTLYTKADIYLLDFPFKGLTSDVANRIMKNIQIYFIDQTFVVNTVYGSGSAFDKTLMFTGGRATDFVSSEYDDLIRSHSTTFVESRVVNKSQVQLQMADALNKQKLLEYRLSRRNQIVSKMRNAVKTLINLIHMVGRERLSGMILRNQDLKGCASGKKSVLVTSGPQKKYGTTRIVSTLLRKVSPFKVAIVVVILAVNEVIQLAQNILLGDLVAQNPVQMKRPALRQYIILTCSMFALEIIWGVMETSLGKTISSSLSSKMSKSISGASSQVIQHKEIYQLTQDANRDGEEIFILTHRTYLSIGNTFVLLNTICLVVYLGPSQFLVLTALMVFNVAFFRHLLITKREVAAHKNKILSKSYSVVSQLITGIETLRHQADMHSFVDKKIETVKDYAVSVLNERYSLHAMKIVSEISTLIMTFWVMNFAVGNRDVVDVDQLPVIFAAILYCVKLSGLLYLIVEDISQIDNLLQVNVIPALSIIDLPQETDETALYKPDNWPNDNSLVFKGVSLYRPFSKEFTIKNISFQVESGQRVAFFGDVKGGANYIFRLICKQLTPSKVLDCLNYSPQGSVEIGGSSIKDINQKYVLEQVFKLSSSPFIMTASLRTNIDPFSQYRDRDILRVIELVGMRRLIDIPEPQNILEYMISYQHASEQVKHSVSMVRVLLRRPAIVICQLVNCEDDEQLLATYLTKTTIIYINPTVESLKSCGCQRLLFVKQGVLAEDGDPAKILRNKTSAFVRKFLPHYRVDTGHKKQVQINTSLSKIVNKEEVEVPV